MHDLEPSALAIRPLYTSQEYKRVRENAFCDELHHPFKGQYFYADPFLKVILQWAD